MPITTGVNLKRQTLFTVTFYANNYTGVNLKRQTLFTVTFYANNYTGVNLKRQTLFTVTFYANNYWRKFEAGKFIYCDILCQ